MKSLLRTVSVVSFAAICLVGLASTPSLGDMAYGVTLLDNQLITVNTATGAGTLVGPLDGTVSPFGLAGFNNKLYTFDSSSDVIRQINTATGGTVTTFNIGIGAVAGQGGLAFQTSTIGYLTTALDPNTFSPANNLYQFNLATGTSTLISQTADTLESIAFAANGTMYGLGKLDGDLYTIDPTTGAMTLVGNVGVSVGSPVGALTFGTNGTLYATLDDSLYTLSLSTGLATAIGDPSVGTGFASISGLAFAGSVLPSAAVPEPSSVILLLAGVAGPSVLALFRKRRIDQSA